MPASSRRQLAALAQRAARSSCTDRHRRLEDGSAANHRRARPRPPIPASCSACRRRRGGCLWLVQCSAAAPGGRGPADLSGKASATFKRRSRTCALRQQHRRFGESGDEPPGRRAARAARSSVRLRRHLDSHSRRTVCRMLARPHRAVFRGVCDTRLRKKVATRASVPLGPATPTNIPYIGAPRCRAWG